MSVNVVSTFHLQEVENLQNSVFVVIDTFRATSSITTLKATGASKIIVTDDGDSAKELRKTGYSDAILIGERNAIKIEGFDYGNTPSLFFSLNFKDKEIIFTSSSGAKAILLLQDMQDIFIGSLLNLTAVTRHVAEIAKEKNKDIIIIPAGAAWEEKIYNIEDWLTAALIAEKLGEQHGFTNISNSDFYSRTKLLIESETDFSYALKNSYNALELKRLGFEKDVNFAVEIDQLSCVPKIEKFGEIQGIPFGIIV